MPIITREGKGSKLTIAEMDGNLTYLDTSTILTEYPTTDASKAGQRFWYKSYEWHYMTQSQIDEIGWLVSEGFPAPTQKLYNPFIQAPDSGSTHYDFLGGGRPEDNLYPRFNGSGFVITGTNYGISLFNTVTSFKNANLLTSLQDIGTQYALQIISLTISAATLNDFFTQLPVTTKTATIFISSVTGGGTCNPTIATAKGYTVNIV
jgi:hypothetical protein